MNNVTKSKSGFTIIEVVLVLAIAGLIFLIVFLAVPALQKSQRDTQRKNDLSRTVAATQSYQSNNRGALPNFTDTTATGWRAKYLIADSSFADPSGGPYTFVTGAPTNVKDGKLQYIPTGKCDPAAAAGYTTGNGSLKVAFVTQLEGGGSLCQNN